MRNVPIVNYVFCKLAQKDDIISVPILGLGF